MTEPLVRPEVPPSGPGCAECTDSGGWWLHLRRCATCGHIGCCDNSPSQHATKHANGSDHKIIRSYEPGEDWYYDYTTGDFLEGPPLAEPQSHPADQSVPGPADRVPHDWQLRLNA